MEKKNGIKKVIYGTYILFFFVLIGFYALVIAIFQMLDYTDGKVIFPNSSIWFFIICIIVGTIMCLQSHIQFSNKKICKVLVIVFSYLAFLSFFFGYYFGVKYSVEYIFGVAIAMFILTIFWISINYLLWMRKQNEEFLIEKHHFKIDMSKEEYDHAKESISKIRPYYILVFFIAYGLSRINYVVYFSIAICCIYSIICFMKICKYFTVNLKSKIITYTLTFFISISIVLLAILLQKGIMTIPNTTYKDASFWCFIIFIPEMYFYYKNQKMIYQYEANHLFVEEDTIS